VRVRSLRWGSSQRSTSPEPLVGRGGGGKLHSVRPRSNPCFHPTLAPLFPGTVPACSGQRQSVWLTWKLELLKINIAGEWWPGVEVRRSNGWWQWWSMKWRTVNWVLTWVRSDENDKSSWSVGRRSYLGSWFQRQGDAWIHSRWPWWRKERFVDLQTSERKRIWGRWAREGYDICV